MKETIGVPTDWYTNRQIDSSKSICPPFLKRNKIIKPLFVQILITFCDIKCMKTRLLTFFFLFFLEIFKMKGAVHEQLHQNPHPLKSQLCAHVSKIPRYEFCENYFKATRKDIKLFSSYTWFLWSHLELTGQQYLEATRLVIITLPTRLGSFTEILTQDTLKCAKYLTYYTQGKHYQAICLFCCLLNFDKIMFFLKLINIWCINNNL